MPEMEEKLAALQAEVRANQEKIAMLDKIVLTGNGTPSLVSQMAAVKTQLGTVTRLLWIVVGGIATIILQGLLGGKFSVM